MENIVVGITEEQKQKLKLATNLLEEVAKHEPALNEMGIYLNVSFEQNKIFE